MLCPCGSEKNIDQCCVPFIVGNAVPPTAEALMRSRYTAFVQGKWDYIERTQVPDPEDPFNAEETAKFAADCEWRGLTIRSAIEKENTAEIEFAVRFRIKGQDILQTERSVFRREEGRWLYVSGEINPKQAPVRHERKIRRNDPCPCGSGKKAKKCCGTDPL